MSFVLLDQSSGPTFEPRTRETKPQRQMGRGGAIDRGARQGCSKWDPGGSFRVSGLILQPP